MIRCIALLFILAGAITTGCTPEFTDPGTSDLVVLCGQLIDGTGAPPRADMAVLVEDGVIAGVVNRADLSSPGPDVTVIDASNMTVIPGLINAHVHVWFPYARWTLGTVTTLGDLGSRLDMLSAMRESFTRIDSPRVLTSGPIVTATGGHPTLFRGNEARASSCQVRDTEHAIRCVINLIDNHGVDYIKIALTADSRPAQNSLTREQVQAIVDIAHARGRAVIAHVESLQDVLIVLDTGVDALAHMPEQYVPDHVWQRAIDQELVVVATLSALQFNNVYRGCRVRHDNVYRLHTMGGLVAVGDDLPGPDSRYGFPLFEMQHLQNAGLSLLDLIVAGTRNSALALGMGDSLGTIEPGKRADLVVIDAYPLADLRELDHVRYIIRDGILAQSRIGRTR